jgi:hypothetical protein
MGVEGQDPEEQCSVCGTKFKNHGERMHTFTPEGEQLVIKQPSKKDKPQPQPKVTILPMPDLVLRKALFRNGLLTTRDIEEAERELTLGIQSQGQTPGVHADPATGG